MEMEGSDDGDMPMAGGPPRFKGFKITSKTFADFEGALATGECFHLTQVCYLNIVQTNN